MPRTIPPLNPLLVFDAVARLGSFTRAAEELNVTQSAVSRQISTLEAYLGQRLFSRERHGVALTAVGDAYRQEVAPAFAMIAAATAKLLNAGRAQPLFLRLYPTFAVKWLIPRLVLFNAEEPQIDVRLNTSVAPVDFGRETVDLAIQLASPDSIEDEHRLLFTDVIQPVCSPALLKGRHPLKTIDDLRHHRLLHSHYRRSDWSDWLAAMGRSELDSRGMEFPSSMLTYQAAAEGLGVAMGQVQLLGQDIASQALVPLFQPLARELAYYAIWPKGKEPNLKARKFLRWLERQVAGGESMPFAAPSARTANTKSR